MAIPTRRGFLVHAENGKARTVTLCTSRVHANNILRDLLLRLDPFTRNGVPISEVKQGTFRYRWT